MTAIVTEVSIIPGTGPAKARLDNWQTALFASAQMTEMNEPDAAHCKKVMSMMCTQLADLVNSDALLSDSQLKAIHPLLMGVAQQFITAGYLLEQAQDFSSFGLLAIAAYINTCRG